MNATGEVDKIRANSPDDILDVASALGLTFPKIIQDFYGTYDYVSFGPEELLAIDQLVDHYELARTRPCKLPRTYLPFIFDSSGGFYFVVCQEAGKPKGPEFGNVLYLPGSKPLEIEFKSSDFSQFLIDRLRFWKEDI